MARTYAPLDFRGSTTCPNSSLNRPPLQKILPPEHLRLEPGLAKQKSFGNGQNTLRGAPLRARQFFKNRPYPATGSSGRTRTYNQLLTRNPPLLEAWTISSPTWGAPVSSLYGAPATIAGFPRCCPLFRGGDSPLSRSVRSALRRKAA